MNHLASDLQAPAPTDSGPHPSQDFALGGDGLQVRCVAPGGSLHEVQRLRREVFLHEQGEAGEQVPRIDDGLDGSATVVVVERAGQAIGTLRVHDFLAPAVQVEYGRLFQIDRFASAWPLQRLMVGSRLAVQSDQRELAVLDQLVGEAYRHALDHDVRFGLLACDPALNSLFEYYGFREYLPPAVLPDGSAVLRMLLVTEDEPHLRHCDSPLRHLVRNPAAGRAARTWLERAFEQA